MKKNRRKKFVIVFAAAVALVALAAMLIFSGVRPESAVTLKPENKAVQQTGQKKVKSVNKKASEKQTMPDKKTQKKPVQEETLPKQNTEQMKETIPSVNSETRQPSAGGNPAPAAEVQTLSQPQTQAETRAHVHSYQLADTRKEEHPSVTKQVWVQDSAAWDEVIRVGYHMSVVTCHQCGAKFSDPAQANALEAWGDHIDAAHNGDGSYDMASSYDVPAETRHHDASGHYEQKIISAAWTEYVDTYRCPCGDQYTKTR